MGTETLERSALKFRLNPQNMGDYGQQKAAGQLANALQWRAAKHRYPVLTNTSWFNPHDALRLRGGGIAPLDISLDDIKALQDEDGLNQILLARIIQYMETFPRHFWTNRENELEIPSI